MKILVDADKLKEAFYIIDNLRRFSHDLSSDFLDEQLTQAYNIIDPMWSQSLGYIMEELEEAAKNWKPPLDPRCDGCEHQHPYAENLSYDIAAGKVYCNRGVTPTYYKEGRTIRYPPNLMICDMYYLNNGKLTKFGTEWNPPCAQYCIPEIEKIMEREVNNHRAIIEILNILDDPNCTRGWNRTTELRHRVRALLEKLI